MDRGTGSVVPSPARYYIYLLALYILIHHLCLGVRVADLDSMLSSASSVAYINVAMSEVAQVPGVS